jgi:hypothetical protein
MYCILTGIGKEEQDRKDVHTHEIKVIETLVSVVDTRFENKRTIHLKRHSSNKEN